MDDEIILTDIRKDWLGHHFIDIVDANIANNSNLKIRLGYHEDITNSDIVIMAAGKNVASDAREHESKKPSRQKMLPENLEIIKEWAQAINQYCPHTIIITATNPADVLNYAFYLLIKNSKRHRFLGYSLNDTVRFKGAISKVLEIPITKIDACIVREHGGSMVPLFSSVKFDNAPISFTEDEKNKIINITIDYLPHMLRLDLPRYVRAAIPSPLLETRTLIE